MACNSSKCNSSNCSCNSTSSCNCGNCNSCNNQCSCTDTCNQQPCGCSVELDMACVRYTGPNLDCVGLIAGETLEQLATNLDAKICDLSSGVDGENGDSAYQIWLNLGNVGTEQDFLDSLVGPAGPIGPTGPQGPQGIQGPAGVGNFKFVKDFEGNLDGSIFTVTRLELLSCTTIPNGCLFDGALAKFTNLHVQVWLRDNEKPTPGTFWYLADSNNSTIKIDNATGTISVELSGGSTDVLARVVVLG